jgi:uncharacterized protein YbjT (DUF2867 family)
MKVLLTGGTGFVGKEIREKLREQGHDVRLLVRPGSEADLLHAGEYDVVRGQILNTNACLHACDGCDAVIHLVGIIREYPAKGITFDETHRVATKNIVDAARRLGVKRFVHMSALGAREDATSVYHRTKYAAEQVVQGSPLRWTIFRPSWIFGPGDHLMATVLDLIHKPVVPLIDGGNNSFQPVARDDVATAMTAALLMPETQGKIYELGGPDRVAFKDVVQKVAEALGVSVRTMNVPSWAVRPVVAAMQRFAFFPLTVDQLRMLGEDNVCEIDPFVKTFRIEPKSFLQSLPAVAKKAA